MARCTAKTCVSALSADVLPLSSQALLACSSASAKRPRLFLSTSMRRPLQLKLQEHAQVRSGDQRLAMLGTHHLRSNREASDLNRSSSRPVTARRSSCSASSKRPAAHSCRPRWSAHTKVPTSLAPQSASHCVGCATLWEAHLGPFQAQASQLQSDFSHVLVLTDGAVQLRPLALRQELLLETLEVCEAQAATTRAGRHQVTRSQANAARGLAMRSSDATEPASWGRVSSAMATRC